MISVLIIVVIFMTFILGLYVWINICNNKTYNQRLRIIENLFDKGNADFYYHLLTDFSNISYDRHLLSLATFRDPLKLYDSRLTKGVE